MPPISSSIPNLINGVSQQPDTLRLASQAEEQVNFLSSVSDGLTRRPGSRHLAKLSATPWDSAFLHTIDRDRTEKYLVSIRDGVLTVFDAKTGVAKTVNAPSGFGYLTGGVKTSYRAVTVADYTFLINRDKTVTMDAAVSPARVNRAIINVRAANYGKTYNIFINGLNRGRCYTPDGSAAAHVNEVRTDVVAGRLKASLEGTAPPVFHATYQPAFTQDAGLPATFTYAVAGDTITITSSSATPFTVRVDDGTGGVAILGVVSKTQRFADLPKTAPDGFSVEITGDNESEFDNYHVKFLSEGSSGVWAESLKGGETFKFNTATMPHVLVRETDGTFTFKPGDWAERKVGDKGSIPDPSFVGRKINDIFFYRNRLGLLSDENVILSKQGEFFDFWRDTATTLLDTDPLDLAVSNSRVSVLNHALPFNQTLLLFSDGAQFVLDGGDILSAETAFVAQATQFENNPDVRPVGSGQFVYFPVPRGKFTGIREYFVETGKEQNDALDVTSHCPRFIPANLFKLAASTSEDILIGLSSDAPNTLWVYKFYFGDQGKLQSAWSSWVFAAEDRILSVEFIDTELYLIVARDDGTYIERIDVESGALDAEATIHYHVDRGLFLTGGVFDGTYTTYTLPYTTMRDLWVFAGGGSTEVAEGQVFRFTRPTSSSVRVTGDTRTYPLFAGVRFLSRYTFSKFFLRKQEAGGGVMAVDDGRLQVRRLFINYAQSGYFNVDVAPKGRDTFTCEFSGRILAGTILAEFGLNDGRFSVPVMSRNRDTSITIKSDSFLPCAFTSAEWEATYHARADRV